MAYYEFRPYVSAAKRRKNAEREIAKLRKKGQQVSPVVIQGRAIAKTFWGKAWCDNLERYSDYSNRLPRGRTYARNGSLLDLQIAPGAATAIVQGSRIYKVTVKVTAVEKARWSAICRDCAGAIDSLVELLQGRFEHSVMERICREKTGLFPAPAEIEFSCSCPDWASMCKHVAAVLYGIGARLDERPELLFNLRRVDERDLIAKAGSSLPLSKSGPASDKVLASSDLSALFGLDFAAVEAQALPAPRGGVTKAVSRRKGTAIEVTNRPPAASRKTKAKRKAAKR